ncbi:Rieske (2Fe-2S) protein [Candidatus Woesearchaeota archaeon]|nr:Rieske (2Fe-2S) protein [Candidatus Woesearchaeota archaeon]
MPNFVEVAKVADIRAGEGKVVNVKGTPVALFNVDGNFHAMSNTCLHMGGPLGEGFLEGKKVTCPWHGWEYDVSTGICELSGAKVASYKVKVEEGKVLVAID